MIKESRIKNQESRISGFTLVELLISLFILTTISSLVVSIVWISLKSTVKANNLSVIRQNGNFAMLQMTKMLQFSNEFHGVSNNVSNFNFNCQSPGASLVKHDYVKFTGRDDKATILGCTNSPSTISSISAAFSVSLINTNKFKTTSCSFTCAQVDTGLPYTIGIEFTIEKKVAAGGSIFDEPAPLLFQNSVTLRNSSD